MGDGGTVRILGIAGSLRRGSFNRAALRSAEALAPVGMTIDAFDITPIPLYNEDVRQQGFPPAVEDLRARVKAADGLLIVTPEYNYSIPGVLKNAIDWAAPRTAVRRQANWHHWRKRGHHGERARAISFAPVFRVPQRFSDEPTGSYDPASTEQIRC
jgi:NAD(P)H-dependent FMN reductase